MKRRSRAGGKAIQSATPQGAKAEAPRCVRRPRPLQSATIQEAEVARLTRELNEALEQQTATSEVLRSSARRLASWSRFCRPCWRTPLASARPNSALSTWDGEALPVVAMHNAPPAFAELRRREPVIRVAQFAHARWPP